MNWGGGGGGGGMAVGRSIIAGRLDGNCWLIHRRLLLVWSFACLMGFSGPAPGEYFFATYMLHRQVSGMNNSSFFILCGNMIMHDLH